MDNRFERLSPENPEIRAVWLYNSQSFIRAAGHGTLFVWCRSMGKFKNLISKNDFYVACKRFLPFVKPYWFLAILGMLLTIPVGALDAVVAYFLKPFMDNVMVARKGDFADYVPYIIVGFTIIQGLCVYFAAWVNGYVGIKITWDIRTRLFDKLTQMNCRYFEQTESGMILFRYYHDPDNACGGLISNLKLFLQKFWSTVGLACVLVWSSWQLSIIALGVLLFIIYPMRVVRKKIDQIINKTVSVGAVTFTIYNETSGGYKAVKSFGLRDFVKAKYTDRARFLQKLGLRLITQTNWLSPFMHVVSAIGVALVIGIGGRLITNGTITAGTFVSFIAALIMLYTPLKSIGNNYIQFQQSLFALDRIYQILDDDKDIEKTADDGIELKSMKDGIEFKNVSFAYVKGKNVLNGINLKIPRGQKVALVGESGGGKTTICSMIPRMYDVSAGEIDIDGTDIRKYTLKSLRQHIAYVFQDNFLFSGTIRDNIALGNASIKDEDVINALKEACLWDFVNSLPEKLDAKVGERGVLLSGGQKQRVAIARAFVRKAEIVIFDEATSALDNTSEKEVQTAIENLMKDRTVLTVAHRLSTIVNCDRILVVNNGQIIEDGNHKTLIEKGGKYAELYNMQFKKIEPSK